MALAHVTQRQPDVWYQLNSTCIVDGQAIELIYMRFKPVFSQSVPL